MSQTTISKYYIIRKTLENGQNVKNLKNGQKVKNLKNGQKVKSDSA